MLLRPSPRATRWGWKTTTKQAFSRQFALEFCSLEKGYLLSFQNSERVVFFSIIPLRRKRKKKGCSLQFPTIFVLCYDLSSFRDSVWVCVRVCVCLCAILVTSRGIPYLEWLKPPTSWKCSTSQWHQKLKNLWSMCDRFVGFLCCFVRMRLFARQP